ncbi:MAG: M3 family oligoendopeptidase [Candidatus Algichlamydia australiensis]|nr:M3 family oligoendopeptidase [Chlamydiales bacterium]
MRQTWDLESLYDEEHFDTFLIALHKQIFKLEMLSSLEKRILLAQELRLSILQASSFAYALLSSNIHHKRARGWEAALTSISSELEKIWMEIDAELTNRSNEEIEELGEPAIYFPLKERRDLAKLKLSVEQEQLISDLSVDGYHSWGQFYKSFIATLTFPFRGKDLSAAQIANKLFSPDRSVRVEAFASYEKVYAKEAPIIAQFLNHLAGFRINVYEHRNWMSAVEDPLIHNRMSLKTLNSMWEAVTESRPVFAKFLMRKAELLGVDKLSWHDLEAPLLENQNEIPYEEGITFIIKQFEKISPKMADFARHAVESNWIETEDRPGKRQGAYFLSFPFTKETRIFMTYSGTVDNLYTLAHELGHCFHSHQVFSLPEMAQHYRKNVAEVASTMAEMIVAEASIERAKSKKEKIALLGYRASRSLAYLIHLQSRYLFESRFYEKRKEKYLSPDELNALMLEAQQECYSNSLSEYHPLLWASRLHFYLTDVPFYNFPYTFGCLFSFAIYRRIKKDPTAFEEAYIPFLHDTGMMSTEELAKKHFNIDIETPEFWREAVAATLRDVHEFLELTETAATCM